jgi:hypothetical protein
MKKLINKRLLSLLLLFGIVGCASVVYDNDFTGWNISEKKLPTVNGQLQKYMYRNFGYKINNQINEIEIKTDGIYRYDIQSASCKPGIFACLNGNILPIILSEICQANFSTPLKSMENGRRIDKFSKGGREIYELPTIFNAKCWENKEYQLELAKYKKSLEEKKVAQRKMKLEGKKSKCREYGFKDDTDGMGLCLIELDKLEAIEQQQINQQLTQNAAIKKQQADAKRQREAQALINLGALISGTGTTNKTNRTTPRINTYPDNFSTTLTVPSNQNCPLKGTPLTKQEVRGSNRICYYQ